MELEGKIWKEGKWWIVEILFLNISTQGKTRKEVITMARSLVKEMVASYFGDEVAADFKITITDYRKDLIGITANDTKLLLALSLRRQREASGSTLKTAFREVLKENDALMKRLSKR